MEYNLELTYFLEDALVGWRWRGGRHRRGIRVDADDTARIGCQLMGAFAAHDALGASKSQLIELSWLRRGRLLDLDAVAATAAATTAVAATRLSQLGEPELERRQLERFFFADLSAYQLYTYGSFFGYTFAIIKKKFTIRINFRSILLQLRCFSSTCDLIIHDA